MFCLCFVEMKQRDGVLISEAGFYQEKMVFEIGSVSKAFQNSCSFRKKVSTASKWGESLGNFKGADVWTQVDHRSVSGWEITIDRTVSWEIIYSW